MRSRLLFATACRIGEIIALQREFIKWGLNEIHWPDSKTGFLVKPLTREVRNLLRPALRGSNSRWVIPSIEDSELPLSYNTVQKAFNRLLKRADISHATLHTIRHRCATEIANSPDIPLKIGMQLTGHKTVATFMGYVHTEKAGVAVAAEQITEQRRELVNASKFREEGERAESTQSPNVPTQCASVSSYSKDGSSPSTEPCSEGVEFAF